MVERKVAMVRTVVAVPVMGSMTGCVRVGKDRVEGMVWRDGWVYVKGKDGEGAVGPGVIAWVEFEKDDG